jgi:peptidoglycan LD-endopeptidase LytH
MQWSHRRSVSCVAVVAGLGLLLGGCSSGDDNAAATWSTPSASEQQIEPTAPAPLPSTPAASPTPSTKPTVKPTATKPATYAFPVIGNNSYAHTHHDYQATDIITKCGNRVVAATTGTILDVVRVDSWKRSVNAGATRGGLSISLLGDDGVRYYGSHMSVINSNIQRGVHVTTGQTLGKTGDTGDASACHLHFGISPPCAKVGDWYTQRGAIYPWPYLDAWKKGTNKSAVAAVKAWQAQHGCPKKPLVDP